MKAALIILGGAAAVLLITKGHYLVRYAWLNYQSPMDEWVPLFPRYPEVKSVDWSTLRGRPAWGDKLLMLQSYTPNIAEYASLSKRINSAYCKKKGYRYKAIVSDGPASDRNPCWDKVHYILQEFKAMGIDPAPTYTRVASKEKDNWIFWIDSDAVIDEPNFGKWIESIAASADDNVDLYICTSIYCTTNINTGAMLIRMTPYMHNFLERWWNWGNKRWHQQMCHEQSALDEMIAKDHCGIVSGGKIALFGCTEFNSTYQHGLRVRGKFIQHYRGCSKEKRIAGFVKAAPQMLH